MKNNFIIIASAILLTLGVYLLFQFSALKLSSYLSIAVIAGGIIAFYIGYRFLMAYFGKSKITAEPMLYADLRAYDKPVATGTVQLYFELPENDRVALVINSLDGVHKQTLIDGHQEAGTFPIAFDTTGLENGTYFYELKTSNFKNAKKLIIYNA